MSSLLVYVVCVFIVTQHFTAGQSWNNNQNQWNSASDYGFYRNQNADPNTCSRNTCRLPKCFCAGKEAPRNMDPSVIPQIVMFTFDDAVNEEVFDYYQELFPADRINPNGCPVSVTFFVSHNWTNYDQVKELYNRGHEIASHSITHRMPQSWWRYGPAEDWEAEIQGQRENIAIKASIPIEEVRGMRAPYLDTGGDEQFKVLDKYGFEYDASYMTGPHDKGGAWPFTLDFVPSWEYCTNLNCPKETHAGIWEVPLNRWVGIDGNGCSMVDGCQQQPTHKGEALAYLWQNFNRHYYGNRSPVGVNMHATWFKTQHHYEAMTEFVKTISEMDDVYLVSVHQTLEWIKNPQTLDRVPNFQPWLTTCKKSPIDSKDPVLKNEINSIENNQIINIEPKELQENIEFDNNLNYVDARPIELEESKFSEYAYVGGRRQNVRQEIIPQVIEIKDIQTPVEIIEDFQFSERMVRPLGMNNDNPDDELDIPVHRGRVINTGQYPLRSRVRPINRNQNYIEQQRLDSNAYPIYRPGILPYDSTARKTEGISSDIEPSLSSYRRTSENIDNVKNIKLQRKTFEDIKLESQLNNDGREIQFEAEENEFESYIDNSAENEVEGKIRKADTGNDVKMRINDKSNHIKNNIEKDIPQMDDKLGINGVTPTHQTEKTTLRSKLVPSKTPVRPRIRPNRPRGGITGRTNLQSRQRNNKSSANSHKLNIMVLTASGTIVVYLYNQVNWV